jgi:hypothetical protein
MSRESKLTMTDFVFNDRFQLNYYISYLFHHLNKSIAKGELSFTYEILFFA